MSERVPCEFSLVRYVPDPVRGEFVNIGIVLREEPNPRATHVRFTRNWERVRSLDPGADVEMLEALEAEIQHSLAEVGQEGTRLTEMMEDSFSHLIQITEPKACLAESVSAEMEQLMRLYVEPRKRSTPSF